MKQFVLLMSVLMFAHLSIFSQENKINVVVIGAHPDDCDIKAGGIALLFSDMGHNVMFVSVTNGDAGHHELGGGALAKKTNGRIGRGRSPFRSKVCRTRQPRWGTFPAPAYPARFNQAHQAMECRRGDQPPTK